MEWVRSLLRGKVVLIHLTHTRDCPLDQHCALLVVMKAEDSEGQDSRDCGSQEGEA